MSNYTQVTFFAPKDALLSGDPNKIIHGTQVDPELAAIAAAISTKFDVLNMGSIAQLAIGSGAVGAPSYSFNSDTTSGMFLNAVGVLEFAAAGVKEALIGGGMQLDTPTGGAKGVGTLNATGLFINGVAVSTAVSANPTATIGLSAVNGTAPTFMTSDSAPPLSQAISPTWTGTHTFSGAGITTTFAGKVVVGAPSSGTAFTVTSAASATAAVLNGSAAILDIVSTVARGSGNTYIRIDDPTGVKAYLGYVVAADDLYIVNTLVGALNLQTQSATRIGIGSGGNVTINTPSAGVGLTLANGVAGQAVLSAGPTASSSWAVFPLLFTIGHSAGDYPRAGYNVTPTTSAGVYNYTSSDFASAIFYNSGGFQLQTAPSGIAGNPITFTTALQIVQAGNVTIGSVATAPSLTLAEQSGTITTLVLGAAGGFATAIKLLGASAAQGRNWMIGNQNNISNALEITPSTANGGSSFTTPVVTVSSTGITIASAGTNNFQVNGLTSPVVQGYGPTAAALVDMTPDTGTFTITYTGFTAGVTGTAVWSRNGNQVLLFLPAATGTSNTTAMTATGIPNAINPTRAQWTNIVAGENNTVQQSLTCRVDAANTLTFGTGAQGTTGGFTASGTKGIFAGSTVQYLLN